MRSYIEEGDGIGLKMIGEYWREQLKFSLFHLVIVAFYSYYIFFLFS